MKSYQYLNVRDSCYLFKGGAVIYNCLVSVGTDAELMAALAMSLEGVDADVATSPEDDLQRAIAMSLSAAPLPRH